MALKHSLARNRAFKSGGNQITILHENLRADRIRSRAHFQFMGRVADAREQACAVPAVSLCRARVPPIRLLLGHWKVTDPKGNQVGTSEISRVSEGCAIRE